MQIRWNHKVVLLIVIMFLSAATLAMSASWSPGFGLFASAASAAPSQDTPFVVLYDQNNNAGALSTNSQNFEAANDPFDNTLADDFVVPGGQTWNVNQVVAAGVYFNGTGPAASFNVIVYPDVAGFPGPTATCTRNAGTFTNVAGIFTVDVSPVCVLPAGTYWVVIQANMDFVPGGQWGWTDRTVQSNNGAAWRNLGGGFAVPNCTANWGRRGTDTAGGGCNIDVGVPDQVFQVLGNLVGGPSPSPSPTPPASPTPSPGTCGTYVQSTSTGATLVPGTTMVPGSDCDDCSNAVTLPFTFLFFGQPFTAVNAVSNGNLQFSSSDTTFTNACLPFSPMNNAILPHWDDLLLDGAGEGIFTSISGSAPNRIFNIEWRGGYFSGGGTANLEARLYEGSGRIDFIYGTVTQTGASATIGLQKDTGSVINQFECDSGGVTSGLQIAYTCSGAGGTPTPSASPSPTATVGPSPSPSCSPAAWQAGPAQPPARYAFQAAMGSDNMLYVAGGQSTDTVPIVYDQVSRYNPATNTWSNVAPMPVPAGQVTVGAANGKVYVAGGFIGGTAVTNVLRIYDIPTNTWSTGPNMPTAVEAAAGALVGNKFYVMGGDDFNNGLNTNQIYDIAANSWSTGATLPDLRTNLYGTTAGGLIYVYGGVVLPAFTTTDTLLRYDPVANSWTNLGSAGTTGARGNYGGISPLGAGQLLITAGADGTGVSTTQTRIFTISSGTFSAGPAMIGSRAGHAQGTLPDGRVLVADGFNTASTTTDTVELLAGPCPGATPSPTPTPSASPTPSTPGSPSPSPSGSPCQTTFTGAIDVSDPTQTGRLFRDGIPDTCAVPGTCGAPIAGTYHYDAHTSVNTTGSPVCVTATLTTACVGTNFIYAGTYLGSFNPASICTNWLADLGSSPNGAPLSYSFTVPAGGTFVNVIAEVTANAGCAGYTLDLAGIPCGTPSPTPTTSPGITPTPTPTPSVSPTPCTVTYTQSTGTGAALVPGTVDTGNHADDGFTAVPLPFTFNFYGQPFTTVNVVSNGNMQFTSTNTAFTNACLPAAAMNNAILPHWEDLRTDQTGTGCTAYGGVGCGIFTSITGSAPNRIFNIEWRTVYFAAPTTRANFEARLYEATGQIDYVYAEMADGGLGATVGIQKDTGSAFTQFECNTGGLSSGFRVTYVPSGACVTPSPGITPTPSPSPTPSTTPSGTLMQFASAVFTDDESQSATITVTRTGNTSGTSSVNAATSDGTATGGAACTAGIDFVNVTTTLTFAPGETSRSFPVVLCSDILFDPSVTGLFETANLTLSAPTGGTLGSPSTATLNINDTANQFRNPTSIDMNLNGPAVPYPSNIVVSGVPAINGGVRVTLFDINHVFPDNIDILLVGPNGQEYILVGDAGGPIPVTTTDPATLTLQDFLPTVLPNNGPLVTGKFKPTNWETPVTNFPAPAPPGPYVEPGNQPFPPIGNTMFGTFGLTNPNGTWSLYVRDDGGNPVVLVGAIAGGWGLQIMPPTAAGASISGRVQTASGAGIRNARVVISGNSLPEARVVTTGSFGYFSFEGLQTGETYVVTVNSQRYTFSTPSRVYTLVDNIADADFIADPFSR